MNDFIVIIQARMSSTRLPGKSMLPICGVPMFHFLVRRLTEKGFNVVIATSRERSDDAIYKSCLNTGINCFRGELNNVFKRYLSISQNSSENFVVRITGDNPLVDVEELLKVINTCTFTDTTYFDGIGDEGYVPGLGFEIISKKLLLEYASEIMKQEYFCEHVTTYFRDNNFVTDLPLSGYTKKKFPNISLTVDTIDDYNKVICLIGDEAITDLKLREIIKTLT